MSSSSSSGTLEQVDSAGQNREHVEDTQTRPKKRPRSLKRELHLLVDNNGKRATRDQPKCPICQLRIDVEQWPMHYEYELGRLNEPDSEIYHSSASGKAKKRGAALAARLQMEKSSSKKKSMSVYEETLEKVQRNRSNRQRALTQLHGSREEVSQEEDATLGQLLSDTQTCFICNQVLHGDSEAVNLHIDQCLANMNNNTAESSTSGGGTWVEYEWAGQTRVRATAMMEGGYSGAGFATASKREEEEDVDEDLDVEDDDAAQYGESQYTERDIVVHTEDETVFELREMVSGGSSARRETSHNHDSPRSGYEEVVSEEGWQQPIASDDIQTAGHSKLVIESLKSRIQQLERSSRSAPRCLICLEPYKTPLASIVCWHVHCEQCWLQTLGSKKLCPQCQKITTPSDLRRIYL